VVSKTRALLVYIQMTEFFVRSRRGIHYKSARFRVVARNMKAKSAYGLAKKEMKARGASHYLDTGIRPKRYRESTSSRD
jgi:hypothetical protein